MEPKTYTWPDIRLMGIALGHDVAKRMPEDLDGLSIGSIIDLAIRARDDAYRANAEVATRPIPPPMQPFYWRCHWEDYYETALFYRLGSFACAVTRDGGSTWTLDFQEWVNAGLGVLENLVEKIKRYYGIDISDRCDYIYVGGPIGLWDVLADVLPEHNYSGRAYRRLIDTLTGASE